MPSGCVNLNLSNGVMSTYVNYKTGSRWKSAAAHFAIRPPIGRDLARDFSEWTRATVVN